MDPFLVVVLIGPFAVLAIFWLLGRYYPGSGVERLGLKSAREPERRRPER